MDHKSSTMVRNTNEREYNRIVTPSGMSGTIKLRDPNSPSSPGSFSKSRSKSPGVGRISSRAWSPGQATLFRRKKIEGEITVDDSLDDLSVSDIVKAGDDEEEDYLKMSLNAIEKSSDAKVKRSGRRPMSTPRKTTSISGRSANSSTRVRGTPRKSYSTGHTRLRVDRFENQSNSDAPLRRRSSGSRSSPRSSRRMSRSKSMDRSKPQLNQKDLPIEIQKRLYAVTDPDISIKEKVELELEFMKGTPEEKRIYLQYRHHFDRQEFFDFKAIEEQQKQDTIEDNAREEKLKEREFLKTVERKKEEKRKKEEEARERERKAIEQAKMHSVETIANAMSEIKNAALKAATVSVARNQYHKKTYEEERRQRVEEFRKKEGKNMFDVQRALKEAVIEQEDPEEKRIRLRGGRSRRDF